MSGPDDSLSTSTRALAAGFRADPAPQPSRDVTGRDLLVILVASPCLFILLVGGAAGLILLYPEMPFDETSPWPLLAVMVVSHASPMAVAWLRMRDRWTSVAHWGLAQFRWVYVPVGIVLGGALSGLSDLLPPEPAEMNIRGDLTLAASFGLYTAVWAPFVEEILFRGLLYRWLTRRFNIPLSIFVSALIFGAAHVGFGWPAIVFIVLVGIAFATVFQMAKTLWPCIIAHVTMNFIYVLALFLGWQ